MSEVMSDVAFDDPDALARVLRAIRPFASLSPAARFEQLRRSGMYAPSACDGVGCDAFDIRADLSVGDACETVDQILRQLQGTLDLMCSYADMSRSVAESCGACASLAKQAGGALAVIKAAIFPGNLP